MNETIEKFGYPATLLSAYEHWVVLLRPAQATLGALVLACSEPATSFAEISVEACTELARVTRDLESTVGVCFDNDKINYLMLMMVDPHVHFHVLPRYAAAQEFAGHRFDDPGWPGPPRLDHQADVDDAAFAAVRDRLLEAWPEVGR